MRANILLVVFILMFVNVDETPTLFGQDESPQFDANQIEFFEAQVRPLLVKHCYECHGPDSGHLVGGLSVASRKDLIEGGDSGPAIVPGDPEESLFIDAINYGDLYEMPPTTKLPDEEIAVLTKWVQMGAPWPAETDQGIARAKFDIESRRAAHWCWNPISNPQTPKVENQDWAQHAIDRFVYRRLAENNLKPAGQAERHTLIRRAYFDLVGLPPTPEQVAKFSNDESPNAFEAVIDELLDSPRFGERWARHWMDLFRYAETCGHEFDYPIPHAYQYRDYLIRALNADVPYDQFIREHISGDLIKSPRLHPTEKYNESILGTGFWFFGEGHHAPVDVKADQAKRIDNQIDVMTKSFLGLTVSCARCHDHKFDAISTKDFYALQGYLKSSRRQEVMLDPFQKIEKRRKAFDQAAETIQPLLDQFAAKSETMSDSDLAQYFEAAITKLRRDPKWTLPAPSVIQGETLKASVPQNGVVQEQEIKPKGKFRWQGNRQLWWLEGNPNDAIKIEFELNFEKPEMEFEIQACLTQAMDYGIVKISLDDKVVVESFDGYSPKLKTKTVSFGRHRLAKGAHSLRIEITGKHEKAIPKQMFGLDYLEFNPVVSKSERNDANRSVQNEFSELDFDVVSRLADAISRAELNAGSHPLYLAHQAQNAREKLDAGWIKVLSDRVEKANAEALRSLQDKTVYETFDGGLPEDWFATGWATQRGTGNSNLFSLVDRVFEVSDAVHSGLAGNKYQGVYRSPTFKIEHEKIFYRMKGNKARIRLIIHGYTLSAYNPLLFNQMLLDPAPSPDYQWVTQAGDLKNHLGREAHIEIIDRNDGHFSVDQIVFGNSTPPSDSMSDLTTAVLAAKPNSLKTLAAAVAKELVVELGSDEDRSQRIQSWILENDLGRLVELCQSSDSLSALELGERYIATAPAWTASELANSIRAKRSELFRLSNEVPSPVLAIGMQDGNGLDENVFVRGNHKNLGEVVPRRFLEAFDAQPYSGKGSGRLELTEQIVSPSNPLTARVAVNRLWHHLIGRGIVASVDNFGVLGEKPTHPDLLDHLATRFIEENWSLKEMIKEIMLSRTYQLASQPLPESQQNDPDNLYLHSANIHRLEGEAIRDAILFVAGSLDQKMYGPSVPIHLTQFMSGRGRPGRSGPLDGNGRRSVYVEVRRNFLSPMMLAFDTPSPFNTLGRRNRSNVPAQALILLNDPFVVEQANKWGKEIAESDLGTEQRIEKMYRSALGRDPTQDEIAAASEFLKASAKELELDESAISKSGEVWGNLCHVLFNLKSFIFVE